MALKFWNLDIPGLHGPLIFGAPELKVRRVQFFQVMGEAEIVGRPAGRSIMVRCLIHDGWEDQNEMQAFLDDLSTKIGVNDTLTESGNIEQEFDDVTFDGWEPIPLNGQEDPGPLYDIAGTLDQDGGWFIQLVLRFRQLRWK
jgi:hypothetical protein